jgi:methylmalonyl-CoA/ethylmalonyl-CoA epimerase
MERGMSEKTLFSKLDHVGVVVRDMETAIAQFSSLGAGPFQGPHGEMATIVPFHGELRGKIYDWKVKISKARMGDVLLELLQPLEGESALKEALEKNGEGLHHLGFIVENMDREIERFKGQGARVFTSSRNANGSGFAYLEGAASVIIELRQM